MLTGEGGYTKGTSYSLTMVDRKMTYKDVHALNAGIYQFVTLHSKRNFEDKIKVTDLNRRRFSWII